MLSREATTLAELFQKRVARSGADEFYRIKVDGRWESHTWAEFARRTDAVTAGLASLGVKNSDAVAILGGTGPEWCLADLSTVMLGAMNVGIYQTLLLSQVRFLVEDAGCKVLFVQGQADFERVLPLLAEVPSLQALVVWGHTPDKQEGVLTLDQLEERGKEVLSKDPGTVERAVSQIKPSDPALVVYTSGTTGQPKGVPLTHQNILSMLVGGANLVEEIVPEDITLSFLPMAHVAEHVPGLYGRMNLGLPTAYATSYETLLDELCEIRPTYFGAVPRIFEKMYGRILERVAQANPRRQAIFGWARDLACRRARSLTGGPPLGLRDRLLFPLADRLVYRKIRDVFGGRVKAFVTGAAPIHIDILEFFCGVGMKIVEVYGLSEATAIAFANPLNRVRLGTVGKALPGVEAKIAEDGEILLRGPTVFSGYLNQPQDAPRPFDEEGFLMTGDIGNIDAEGYLRITDRKKNLIKTAGGKYVAPARLEALLKQEPLISQVYVHGDHKPYVVALVTLDERETGRVAEELGVAEETLATTPEVCQRISKAVAMANDKLARFEQIKRHAILPHDFSIEEGTLTPTMKLKRREVAQRYSNDIEGLYA